MRLPAFDVGDDLGRHLTLLEVDYAFGDKVLVSVLDELKGGEEDT